MNKQENKTEPFLFVSIDLAGSTALKYEFKFWNSLIYNFYKKTFLLCEQYHLEYKEHTVKLSNWKLIGDELTFYTRINILDDIRKTMNILFMIKRNIDGLISNYVDGLNNYSYIDPEFKRIEPPDREWTKFTAWLGNVTKEYSSGIYDVSDSDIYLEEFDDFLGPRIDEGFRIAKFSETNGILVSCELAYIYKYIIRYPKWIPMGHKPTITLKSLVELKGINSDSDYPIYIIHMHKSQHREKMKEARNWIEKNSSKISFVTSLLKLKK